MALKVSRRNAEDVRRVLASVGIVDSARTIVEQGDSVILPLVAPPPGQLLQDFEHEMLSADFPLRPARTDPIDDIRRIAEVDDGLKHLLPRKWELLGDVLVIRLPDELDAYEEQVARAYSEVLGAKTVLRDTGGVTGELRTPVIRKILGSETVTIHKENGVLFKLDVSQVMFSSGNVDERIRASKIVCDGETIVDMFAGIGYFSIPLAVHGRPRRIIACELNPVAYAYLVENTCLNSVEEVVEPVLGDNRNLKGESIADRIFMGYVKTTHEYLETAVRLLKSKGVLHYHETCPCDLLPDRPVSRIEEAMNGGDIEVLGMREVKSYSPGVSHVVVDARIIKPG